MTDPQPRILFLSLSDDVGSERILSEMGRRGVACAVMGRRAAFAAKSVHAIHHHVLPSRCGLWAAAAAVPARLERLVAGWSPDAVVPLDDMASLLLRDVATRPGTGEVLRHLIVRSLGDPRHYATACRRVPLIELAASLGLRTPAQRRIGDLAAATAAARDLGYPLMVKRDGTCGGGGVSLVRNEAELVAAALSASRKARAKDLARRLFGLAPATGGGDALSLQAYVPGVLALRTVACEAGRVLDGVSFAAERLDPPVTGSSTVLTHLESPEMETTARRLVAALGCSGFVSFDFVVSAAGAHLIEMNARPVGSGHLGLRSGHDVYGAWLARFPGFRDASPARPAQDARPVALFPKEMRRDPDSDCFAPAAPYLHDIPWDEPRVVAAYRDLLQRRHPDRLASIARSLAAAPDGVVPPRRAPFRSRLAGLLTTS